MAAGGRRAEQQPDIRGLELRLLAIQVLMVACFVGAAYAGLGGLEGGRRHVVVVLGVTGTSVHAVYVLGWRARGHPVKWMERLAPVNALATLSGLWYASGSVDSPLWATFATLLAAYARRRTGRSFATLTAGALVAQAITGGVLLHESSEPFVSGQLGLILGLTAAAAGLAQWNASTLRAAERRARTAAETDVLTGVANRVSLDRALSGEAWQAEEFAVVVLDLDNFKQLNDTRGHLAGDEVLRETGQVIQRSVRPSDTVARWGGEEFVIILPGATLEAATRVAERVRSAVADQGRVTLSAGVAVAQAGELAEQVIRRSDDQLREAKRLGKNRVQSEHQPKPGMEAVDLTPLRRLSV